MKKFCFLVLALLLGIGLAAGTAFADNPAPPKAAHNTPYTTLNLSETLKSSFDWNETPYLFLWLPIVNSTRTLDIKNIWKFGDTVVDTQTFSYTGKLTLKDWTTLSDWTTERKVGDWSISTEWGYSGSKYKVCCQETKFTVTPEPVSMVLFGLGAGVLGLVQLRRKKK